MCSQTELFDLFQKHRNKLLVWLQANPSECNDVMEGVVRVLTLTGAREAASTDLLDTRTWQSMPEHGYRGRFRPVQIDLQRPGRCKLPLLKGHRLTLGDPIAALGGVKSGPRHTSGGKKGAPSFVLLPCARRPDTEAMAPAEQIDLEAVTYEEWLLFTTTLARQALLPPPVLPDSPVYSIKPASGTWALQFGW